MNDFRKAFRLSSVLVQHYRSLSDVEVSNLGDLTILVGSNAAGKSNFIDALRFLRDALTDGVEHAISIRQGLEIIRQYSKTRPYDMRFRLQFTQCTPEGQPLLGAYELEIASQSRGTFRIKRESCSWYDMRSVHIPRREDDPDDDEGDMEIVALPNHFERGDDGVLHSSLESDDPLDESTKNLSVAETELALGKPLLWSELGQPVAEFLRSFKFTVIYPNVLRVPGRPDTDRQLKENGENWASVIKNLRQSERGKSTINSIVASMRAFLPSLQDVHIRSLGGYLVPQFLVKERDDTPAHYFDPVQLSDGTLRAFGLMLALYQVPRPPLLALEEPELTVQPSVLPVLADAFKEISQTTQLIVSSHSPHLVDLFDPDVLRLVVMEKGETQIAPVSAAQRQAVKDHLTTIPELMVNDNLRPETQ